jgi:hypothetical protein
MWWHWEKNVNHCWCWKATNITYFQLVSVALFNEHADRMRLITCHLWLYHNFPHYVINCTISRKKVLKTECVFWFSLQRLSKICLILKIIQGDIDIKVHSLHAKYPLLLSDFNGHRNFSTDFRMIRIYHISRKSVYCKSSSFMREGGQMYSHDKGNSRFSQFCKSS